MTVRLWTACEFRLPLPSPPRREWDTRAIDGGLQSAVARDNIAITDFSRELDGVTPINSLCETQQVVAAQVLYSIRLYCLIPDRLFWFVVCAACPSASDIHGWPHDRRRRLHQSDRWSDLNPVTKTLRIERAVEDTKAHGLRVKGPKKESHKRTITIDDDLLALLLVEREKHLRLIAGVPDGAAVDLALIKLPEETLMFPNSFTLTVLRRPRNMGKEFARRARRLGFKKLRFHDLRGSHETMLLDAGARCMWWPLAAVMIRRRCYVATPSAPRRPTPAPLPSLETSQGQSWGNESCLVPGCSQFVLFSQFVLSGRTGKPLILLRWRGGRVVEGTSLENWQRRKAFVGSNPTLSANYLFAVVRWHPT